jgi:hypothetical protein
LIVSIIFCAGNKNDITVSIILRAGNENNVTVSILHLARNGIDVTVAFCGNDAHLWYYEYGIITDVGKSRFRMYIKLFYKYC